MKRQFWSKQPNGEYGFSYIYDPVVRPIRKNNLRPNYVPQEKLMANQPVVQVAAAPAEDPYFSPTSPVWLYLIKVIDAEIKVLRERNDNPLLDAIKTASIRGEIKGLKRLKLLQERRDKGDEKHLIIE